MENTSGAAGVTTSCALVDASLDDFSKIETDYGTAFSDYSSFAKVLITPIEFPPGKTIGDVFCVGFANESNLLEKYHSERGDSEQKFENWRATKDGVGNRGQRTYSCMTPIKIMFGKRYLFSEVQRYAMLRVNGSPTLIIQFSSQIPGLMNGDAFRAEALIVFTQRGEGSEAVVRMEAFGHVQFNRNVWIKAKVLHNTLDIEFPESYKKMGEMIVSRLRVKDASHGQGGDSKEESVTEVGESGMMAAHPLPPPIQQTRGHRWAQCVCTMGLAVWVMGVSLKGLVEVFLISLRSSVPYSLCKSSVVPLASFFYLFIILGFLQIFVKTYYVCTKE